MAGFVADRPGLEERHSAHVKSIAELNKEYERKVEEEERARDAAIAAAAHDEAKKDELRIEYAHKLRVLNIIHQGALKELDVTHEYEKEAHVREGERRRKMDAAAEDKEGASSFELMERREMAPVEAKKEEE